MKNEPLSWVIAGFIALGLSCVVAYFVTDLIVIRGLLGGWLFALINAFVASFFNRKAVGKGSSQFLVLTVCGLLLRVALVVGSVYAVYTLAVHAEFSSFIMAVFIGMFVYMVRENLSLCRAG